MDVKEAVMRRRSVRGFLPKPVDPAIVRRVMAAANRAPSGGNVQPWHITAATGAPLAALKRAMAESYGAVEPEPEYAIYPPHLPEPYRSRRFANGEQLYASLGIPRADKAARLRWLGQNYQFFGAPAALFIHTPRFMGPPQWADLGMWMQSVMLLLLEEGLQSCAQECWSRYPGIVRRFLPIPTEHVLFAAIAIGHEDKAAPANALRTDRAPLDEVATFIGFPD